MKVARTSSLEGTVDLAVSDALARARAAWPTIPLDEPDIREAFGEEVSARLDAAPETESAIKANACDLLLAFLCARGDRDALHVLESSYLTKTADALARMGFAPLVVDETLQELRATLLVATDARAPQIRDFSGRGPLRAWMQIVASRIAFRLARPTPRHVALEESLPADASGDIELAFLKKTYGATFREAFREALATLEVPDRLLLKQKFSQQMTVVELGLLYNIHPSSISRRVTNARHRLVASTRDAMMQRMQLDAPELSSVLRLIQSEVDISLSTYGRPEPHEMSG